MQPLKPRFDSGRLLLVHGLRAHCLRRQRREKSSPWNLPPQQQQCLNLHAGRPGARSVCFQGGSCGLGEISSSVHGRPEEWKGGFWVRVGAWKLVPARCFHRSRQRRQERRSGPEPPPSRPAPGAPAAGGEGGGGFIAFAAWSADAFYVDVSTGLPISWTLQPDVPPTRGLPFCARQAVVSAWGEGEKGDKGRRLRCRGVPPGSGRRS